MPPRSPWNNKKQTTIITNVRKTAAVDTASSPAINYEEVQKEEIEALQAIFMEDYEEVATKGAWSKTSDRAFKLKLGPYTTDITKQDDFVVLSVTLTATYPKTVPLLEVQGLDTFHERSQARINSLVNRLPTELLGEPMIHTVSSEIQDALEDAIIARAQGTLPSLDLERASAEEVALGLAKQAEEEEARRLHEAQQEEGRMLKLMVNQELDRRDKRKSLKSDLQEEESLDVVIFDQTAKIQIQNNVETFREVSITCLLPSEDVYLGKPKVSGLPANAPLVAVLRRKVEKLRSDIIELEAILDAAHKLKHPNLVNVFAYRVERINNHNSTLTICREYADRGSLHDLLYLGNIHANKARQFTIQLLEGLDFLHHNGVSHGGISTRTIYLSSHPTLLPKLADFGYASIIGSNTPAIYPRWTAPSVGLDSKSLFPPRSKDIWNLGVVVVQMFLGLSTPNDYNSPSALLAKVNLSESFEEFLIKIFSTDIKKRPSCFDLLPAEFLRIDSPIVQEVSTCSPQRRRKPSIGLSSPSKRRSRHNSSNQHDPFSRYLKDFTELGRLGKGGFGEVVQARNKLDGGVYAVKKIKQAPQLLDQVLSEVILLNRLNHPYVVRYYNTWVEEETGLAALREQEETPSITEDATSDEFRIDFGYASTGGLDFVSSTGYPGIEFGDDDDDDDEEEPSEDDIFERNSTDDPSTIDESADVSQPGELRLNKTRSDSRRSMSTLYIQMELCDRRSLRDLIRRTMDEDDCWRFIRQIAEGLAHIHSHGIIHRDLKPDNIFIDSTNNPKIGDFGLATTGRQQTTETTGSKGQQHGIDMTRSIGTALYVAPELQSSSGPGYNDKVDMYSLGIMFFEMCHQPFNTAMERITALQSIRKKDHELPLDFEPNGAKAAQGKLVKLLIAHKPSERPTSSALLRMDVLPLEIGDETIRQALSGLSDPRSPYHQKLISALFAHDNASSQLIKAGAWEAKAPTAPEDVNRIRLRAVARAAMELVFRRHGAEEVRRDSLFPRSGIYTNPNVVQLLDASGNLLQLPHDLTLPYAQQLARQHSNVRCNFTFGGAYRDVFNGGPPRVNDEVDFDIVNNGRADDLALNDAEVIKVLDEIISELPTLGSSQQAICFHVSHGMLLDLILEHCRVPTKQHHAVKETLSKLGVHQWAKLRPELRDIGLSDTTLDDLKQFDWRDTTQKAVGRLRDLLGIVNKTRLDLALHHLLRVLVFVKSFEVVRKVFVSPLSCFNAKFYKDGLLFRCILERKKTSVVLAAGGRYDSLIHSHRAASESTLAATKQGAVGVCIGIDIIVAHMAQGFTPGSKVTFLKDQAQLNQLPRRCDVLVIASGSDKLRDTGIKVVSALWAGEISAELSRDGAPDRSHLFIVSLRHETSTTARITNTSNDSDDSDVPIPSLISHIQQELRNSPASGSRSRQPLVRNLSSHHHHDSSEHRRADNVQVLLARHGSKKSNKFGIVQAAQQRWEEKLERIKGAPILAVETRDEVLSLIQNTRLGDGESWKKAIQGVQLNERQYVKDVQDMLEAWRAEWAAGDEALREACVYNFRTGTCVYYDLGA